MTGIDTEAAEPAARKQKKGSAWRELPILVIVAVGLAFLIKSLFVQAFFIPSASMEHTLHGCPGCTGDRVLVNKLVYDFRDPHRGEIVVFNGKNTAFQNVDDGQDTTTSSNELVRGLRHVQSFIGLAGDPNEKDFVKRVIAVGGDTVSCPALPTDANRCAGIVVNGHVLDESSYLFEDMEYTAPFQQPFTAKLVPKGQLWVMGDHRDDSSDSRVNGTVPVSNVIGRAFVKVWPPSRIGGLGVPKVFQQNLSSAAHAGAPVIGLAGAVPIVGLRRRRRRRRSVSA